MLLVLVACSGPEDDADPASDDGPAAHEPAEGPVMTDDPEHLAAPVKAATAFAESRPMLERPLGDGTPVEGLPDLSAETCATCHVEIAKEWRTSVHSQAWVDPQYQAEIAKSGNKWLCLNCHTPLRSQQETLAVGLQEDDVERPILVRNPTYDAGLRDEGITCAACHVRDGVVHGPGLAEGESIAPHPVKADPAFRTTQVCERCHQAVATFPGKSFICVFDTGDEWREGPYDDEGKGCIDCHMPSVERPAAVGGPVRKVGRHWWRGSGIPKIPGRYPPAEANPPGLGLTAELDGREVVVTATNANAGHMLPSGDPERKVHVRVVVDGSVVHTETYGQSWTWNPPTKHGDTRLAPRESRTFRVPLPEFPDTIEAIEVVAESERMSEENREYHGLEGYPIAVETHRLELDP